MRVFNLPDLGEGLQEAEIVEWRVAEGADVAADQPIVSVETAKAIVDIPAPWSGKVERLFAKAGDVVHVGAPLIGFAGDAADAGTVVGHIPASEPTRRAVVPAALPSGNVKVAPAVRALAQKLHVNLATITPSGPDGLITTADVERASLPPATGELPEPLRGVRRTMAQNMTRAHAEVAQTTIMDDADIHDWVAGNDITMRLVQAIVAGCRAEPALNAWYDARATGRRLLPNVDVGIAMDTADGLFVPVLRDVANRSADDLRRGLNAMRTDVTRRTIPPGELRGATFTLSNYGMIAGRYSAPLVMPPTVSILGAGRIFDGVVARAGNVVIRRLLPLSLSFDHRVVTGGEAGRFLEAVMADLRRQA